MATWREMSLGCLSEAQALFDAERWRGCASRAYYAAYCAVASELVKRVTGKPLSAEPLLKHLRETARELYGV